MKSDSQKKIIDFSNKIGLGSVQFGLDYGISNHQGRTSVDEAISIIEYGHKIGINFVDTAQAYGSSEQLIAGIEDYENKINVITKGTDINQSIQIFSKKQLYGFLFHNENDLMTADSDNKWAQVLKAKQKGLVKKIGVSVYTPAILKKILSRYPIDLIQVPGNLLDHRFFTDDLVSIYKSKKIEVHIRSIFLQGFFFLTESTLPKKMAWASETLKNLITLSSAHGLKLPEASISSCLDLDFDKKIIIGVTSLAELKSILEWPYSRVSDEVISEFKRIAQLTSGRILNPSLWGGEIK